MRIFLTKVFAQFARKERIADDALREAVTRAEAGLIDAYLGGSVIKQRIARAGGGKSGGYRTVVLFRQGTRAVFMYGFAKSERDNVDQAELRDYRSAAHEILNFSETEMNTAVERREFREITRNAQGL